MASATRFTKRADDDFGEILILWPRMPTILLFTCVSWWETQNKLHLFDIYIEEIPQPYGAEVDYKNEEYQTPTSHFSGWLGTDGLRLFVMRTEPSTNQSEHANSKLLKLGSICLLTGQGNAAVRGGFYFSFTAKKSLYSALLEIIHCVRR